MRRPWAAALALTMVLGLAACGGGESADTSTPPVEVTAEATGKPTVAPTATVKPTVAPTPEAPPLATNLLEYGLTEIALPEGWATYGIDGGGANWLCVYRTEVNGYYEGIFRADGTLFTCDDALEGGVPYSGEGPGAVGNTRYACLRRVVDVLNSEFDFALFDVEEGKVVVPYQPYESYQTQASQLVGEWPKVQRDSISSCHFVNADQSRAIPEDFYRCGNFRDGYAAVWTEDRACHVIDSSGQVAATGPFSYLTNCGDGVFVFTEDARWGLLDVHGGKTYSDIFDRYMDLYPYFANRGIFTLDDRYYDYRLDPITDAFDWAGPIGDDGAGFVCRDGKLCRIQF